MQEFCRLVRERDHGAFHAWLQTVWESGIAELGSFATGRQDRAAVEAARSSAASSGLVEGHGNRIKTVKGAMYGRADFDLPRQPFPYPGWADGRRAVDADRTQTRFIESAGELTFVA